jgi:two-component system, OmpR family, phosphate regulon sensor histidine kinase PhoR
LQAGKGEGARARVGGSVSELERRRRDQLAEAIVRRRDEVERRWLERIARAVGRSDLSTSELRNAMPEYLLRLAAGLWHESTASAGGVASWEAVAREHADARVRLGFDIDELVQDFVVLRQVLSEVLDEEEALYDARQSSRLADLIEGAVASAVKSYVEARDHELRRQHAEHVAFITHELRTPLSTAMLGVAQLRRGLSSALSPAAERILQTVERNHRKLDELIDGVLIVERGAHHLKPKLVRITVGRLLDDCLASARLAAEAKALRFEAHIDPSLEVHVDPNLAISAVDNVVQNAVKYTDEGTVEVSLEDRPNDVVVHVRDNCPGIPPVDLARLFEPFSRGDSRKPGTGLGLAIARRALEAQGGTIDVEPGEGRGCHFWLTLPKMQHH